MITGWKQNYGSWYYYKKDGSKANNEWVDDTYYVNEYGVMCTNQWVNDFTYVGNDGKRQKILGSINLESGNISWVMMHMRKVYC